MTIEHSVLLGVNIPNMTRWVERLERNEDPQTKGALQRVAVGQNWEPIGFCCLGIACDEAAKDGAITNVTEVNGLTTYEGVSTVLVDSMNDWLGWGYNTTGLYGHPPNDDFTAGGALTTDNDVRGKTFPEIAAIIRREWLEPAIAAQAI